MSTKLFMTSKMSEYVDSVTHTDWDHFNLPTWNYTLDTNKYGEPVRVDNIVSPVFTPGHRPHLWDTGTYRGISRRLAPQTIDGEMNLLMFLMHNAVVPTFSRLYVYIIDTTAGDNAGVLVTILGSTEDSAPPATRWSQSSLSSVSLARSVPLTPFTVPDDGKDYRLVVEFGGVTIIGFQMDFNIVIRQQVGARKEDLTGLDDIPTEGGAAYFEFTSNLVFKGYQLPFNHEIELALPVGSVPTQITVTPTENHPLWWMVDIQSSVIAAMACSPTVRAKVAMYRAPIAHARPVDFLLESNWSGAINHVQAAAVTGEIYFKTWPETTAGTAYSLWVAAVLPDQQPQPTDLLLTATDQQTNMFDPTVRGRYPTHMINSVDGNISAINGQFTSSKLAVALYAGRWGMVNSATRELFIHGRAPLLPLLTRVYTGFDLGVGGIGTDFVSFFILGARSDAQAGENRVIFRFDHNGKHLYPPWWTLPVSYASPYFGIDRSSTVLYYGTNTPGGLVYPHNLATNTSGAPFAGPGAAWAPTQVIVLSNDTICALFQFHAGASNESKIYHYNSVGTVLHSHTLTMLPSSTIMVALTHVPNDDPDLVWIRYYSQADLVDRFVRFRLSTGTIDHRLDYGFLLFNNGKGPETSCNNAIWGPQIEGAMVPMMITPSVAGIYVLNPKLKHDAYYHGVDVKIPDPTIRTAFLGE